MKHIILFLSSLVLLYSAMGCVAKVFNDPITISTKSNVYQKIRPIETVSAEYSDVFFLLFPIPSDPRDVYDDLLNKANEVGANAVIDVQLRNKNMFFWMFPPIVINTMEAKGTAVIIE